MRTKTTVRRALALLLSTLGVAASVGLAAAPAAHADAGACGAGYACVFQDNGLAGLTNLYKNAGNASPNVTIRQSDPDIQGYLWNHGRSSELQVTMRYVDGRRFVFCLTHGENWVIRDGDTDSPTVWDLYANETVLSWTWRSTRCPNAYYREGVFI